MKDNYQDTEESQEKQVIVSVVVLILATVILTWYFLSGEETSPEKVSVEKSIEPEPVPLSQEEHTIKFPVPEKPPVEIQEEKEKIAVEVEVEMEETQEPVKKPEPLPALDESDATIRGLLEGLMAPLQFSDLFLVKTIIRHFVVTIDNMTNKKLPQKFVFTKSPVGKFLIKKDEAENVYLDPANFNRYSGFIQLVDVVDTRKLVAVYIKYYPLFQKAYEDLGYPNRYFNDRFIKVIDHLLYTPDVKGTIELKQPKVFYTFADPELEALSAGQKILIRIGMNNATKVKAKLKEIRKQLAKG